MSRVGRFEAVGSQRNQDERVKVKCAYCRGTGRDRFIPGGKCHACSGKGYKMLRPPVGPCPKCRGRGYAPNTRLNCSKCLGLGQVHLSPREVQAQEEKERAQADEEAARSSPRGGFTMEY